MSQAAKIALTTLLLQMLITLIGTTVVWFYQGLDIAKAASFGGLIGVISTGYLAFRLIPKSAKVDVIGRLGITQFSRYAMIIALFYVALKVLLLAALPVIVFFAATQIAYWLILIFNVK